MTTCSQMAPLEAAQHMIGLGTLGSLKIWYKYQQESPALCGSYIYYEFCYIVLTPSEFVLVPLGIGDLEWKYSF